jgi:hypothetical protein
VNTRIGLTLSVPVGQRQSLKLAWSDGTAARTGGNFKPFTLAWQHAWIN